MPKFGITIDANYRRFTEHTDVLRRTIRQTVHPPKKRATTGMLFVIGVAALILASSSLYVVR